MVKLCVQGNCGEELLGENCSCNIEGRFCSNGFCSECTNGDNSTCLDDLNTCTTTSCSNENNECETTVFSDGHPCFVVQGGNDPGECKSGICVGFECDNNQECLNKPPLYLFNGTIDLVDITNAGRTVIKSPNSIFFASDTDFTMANNTIFFKNNDAPFTRGLFGKANLTSLEPIIITTYSFKILGFNYDENQNNFIFITSDLKLRRVATDGTILSSTSAGFYHPHGTSGSFDLINNGTEFFDLDIIGGSQGRGSIDLIDITTGQIISTAVDFTTSNNICPTLSDFKDITAMDIHPITNEIYFINDCDNRLIFNPIKSTQLGVIRNNALVNIGQLAPTTRLFELLFISANQTCVSGVCEFVV